MWAKVHVPKQHERNIQNLIIPDFDDDGTLDHGDLEKLVNCLTGESADTRLTPEEMSQLINNVNMLCNTHT